MVDFSNVFMIGVSHFRTLQLRLARRLREEHGAKVNMYCVLEQQRGFWQPALDEGVLASIRVDNLLYQTTDLAVDDPESVIDMLAGSRSRSAPPSIDSRCQIATWAAATRWLASSTHVPCAPRTPAICKC
jgi:hypothetical protein